MVVSAETVVSAELAAVEAGSAAVTLGYVLSAGSATSCTLVVFSPVEVDSDVAAADWAEAEDAAALVCDDDVYSEAAVENVPAAVVEDVDSVTNGSGSLGGSSTGRLLSSMVSTATAVPAVSSKAIIGRSIGNEPASAPKGGSRRQTGSLSSREVKCFIFCGLSKP